MSINFRSYHDLSIDIWRHIGKLSGKYDLIVGVPRSGVVPAAMVASYLDLPLSTLDLFVLGRFASCGITRSTNNATGVVRNGFRVLVLDDSCYSGQSMKRVREKIASSEALLKINNLSIDYAVVYCLPGKDDNVDFVFEHLSVPRLFQWNAFNHSLSTRMCYDIDGVVCDDPTESENDDGPRYLDFLNDANAKVAVSREVGCFVSSRLEKYRAQTAKWLQNHGYHAEELILLDLPNAKTRQKAKCHAQFKAEVYKSRNEILFIESDFRQACMIAEISGKDVLCTESMTMIRGRQYQEARNGDDLSRLQTAAPTDRTKEMEASLLQMRKKYDSVKSRLEVAWSTCTELKHALQEQKQATRKAWNAYSERTAALTDRAKEVEASLLQMRKKYDSVKSRLEEAWSTCTELKHTLQEQKQATQRAWNACSEQKEIVRSLKESVARARGFESEKAKALEVLKEKNRLLRETLQKIVEVVV